jgi:hypothetical protein
MHATRISLRLAVSFLVVLTSVDPLFGQASKELPPVLTVCEALHNLRLYKGKDVVIVGRSGWTFYGTFLGEDCGPDGRTVVQGKSG